MQKIQVFNFSVISWKIFVSSYFSNDDHGIWKYQANVLGKKYYGGNTANASSFTKYFKGKANFTAKFEFNFLVEHGVAALHGVFCNQYFSALPPYPAPRLPARGWLFCTSKPKPVSWVSDSFISLFRFPVGDSSVSSWVRKSSFAFTS